MRAANGWGQGCRHEGLAIASIRFRLAAGSIRVEEYDRGRWARMDGYAGACSRRWPFESSGGTGKVADFQEGCGGLRRGETALEL